MAIEDEYAASLLTQNQVPAQQQQQQTSVGPANPPTLPNTSVLPAASTLMSVTPTPAPPVAPPTTIATTTMPVPIHPQQSTIPTMSTITHNGFHHPSATFDPNNPLAAVMAATHGVAHPAVAPVDSGPVRAYAKLEGDEFCYYIRTLQVTLGRKASTTDNVDVPLGNTKSVSRQHARLFYNFSTQRFEMNVFGKNGAFVNEQFVEKGVTVPLENRTKIQIGEVSFSFLLPRMDLEEVQPEMAMSYTATPQQIEQSALTQRINTAMVTPKTEEGSPLTPTTESFDTSQYTNKDTKPPFSYASLIAQAINSTPTKKMTLNGIYNYITTHYPYYQMAQNGWQNSIRHNLSLNKAFVKVPRGDSEPGKGAFWTIDVTCESQFSNGVYKRNRRSNAKGPSLTGRRDSLMGGMSPYDVDVDMSSGLMRKRPSIRKGSASEIDDLAAGKRSATPGDTIDPTTLNTVTPTSSENGHDMMEMDYHHMAGGGGVMADPSALQNHQTPPDSRGSADEMDDEQQHHGQAGSIIPLHATSAAQAQLINAQLTAQVQARLLRQQQQQTMASQVHPLQSTSTKVLPLPSPSSLPYPSATQSSSHGQNQPQHQEQHTVAPQTTQTTAAEQ